MKPENNQTIVFRLKIVDGLIGRYNKTNNKIYTANEPVYFSDVVEWWPLPEHGTGNKTNG